MKKQVAEPAAAKLKKLSFLAQRLRGGEHFEVTRPTTLKSCCEDAITVGRFALPLAGRSKRKAIRKCKPLIANAVRQLKKHLARREEHAAEPLWQALRELEDSQNKTRDARWERVRTTHCREALLSGGPQFPSNGSWAPKARRTHGPKRVRSSPCRACLMEHRWSAPSPARCANNRYHSALAHAANLAHSCCPRTNRPALAERNAARARP
jgi:hypothetical protein